MRMKNLSLGVLLLLGACVPIPKTRSNPSVDQLNEIGAVQIYQRNFDRAEAAFLTSWQIDETPEAANGLGCIAFYRGDNRRAKELFTLALRRAPHFLTAKRNLAILAQLEGKTADAGELYDQLLDADPVDFRSRNNLAVLTATHHDLQKSQAQFLKGLAATGNHPLYDRVIEQNFRIVEERK